MAVMATVIAEMATVMAVMAVIPSHLQRLMKTTPHTILFDE